VIAPHFQASGNACADGPDVIAANDLDYACSDWKDGLLDKSGTVDSYTVLDALLAAAKSAFPGLVRVTIVGYSAGGQTIQRYAGGNKEHARTPSIATRYVIGSPGTYMYLDAQRVKADAVCTSASACALDATSFEVPAYAPDCTTTDSHVDVNGGAYDDYKYGLANRGGYLASIADVDLVAQYVARPIVYVLSEGDSRRVGVVNARYPSGTPTAYTALDKDCPAIVQAPAESSFRLQRGLVYHRYVTSVFGATHRVVVVPECGHDDACVLGSAQGLAEIFGP
jgi:pimeloyl-ACP methyl ester carboxylesterase